MTDGLSEAYEGKMWDVFCENNELKEENAKLFSLLKHESGQVEKLRELVRDMWDFFCIVPDEPYTSKEEIDFSIEVWKRMRELGIEAKA